MSITRMRDTGRSWTEIAEATGLTVPEAKAAVQADKRQRRVSLARTPSNEYARGLLDECKAGAYALTCRHTRKEHDEAGACRVCPTVTEGELAHCAGFTTTANLFGRAEYYHRRKPNDVPARLWAVMLDFFDGDRVAATRALVQRGRLSKSETVRLTRRVRRKINK